MKSNLLFFLFAMSTWIPTNIKTALYNKSKRRGRESVGQENSSRRLKIEKSEEKSELQISTITSQTLHMHNLKRVLSDLDLTKVKDFIEKEGADPNTIIEELIMQLKNKIMPNVGQDKKIEEHNKVFYEKALSILEYLINDGVDLSIDVLCHAIRSGFDPIALLLAREITKRRIDIDKHTRFGMPLICAINFSKNWDLISLLINKSKISLKNIGDENPFLIVFRRILNDRYLENKGGKHVCDALIATMKLLIKRGADVGTCFDNLPTDVKSFFESYKIDVDALKSTACKELTNTKENKSDDSNKSEAKTKLIRVPTDPISSANVDDKGKYSAQCLSWLPLSTDNNQSVLGSSHSKETQIKNKDSEIKQNIPTDDKEDKEVDPDIAEFNKHMMANYPISLIEFSKLSIDAPSTSNKEAPLVNRLELAQKGQLIDLPSLEEKQDEKKSEIDKELKGKIREEPKENIGIEKNNPVFSINDDLIAEILGNQLKQNLNIFDDNFDNDIYEKVGVGETVAAVKEAVAKEPIVVTVAKEAAVAIGKEAISKANNFHDEKELEIVIDFAKTAKENYHQKIDYHPQDQLMEPEPEEELELNEDISKNRTQIDYNPNDAIMEPELE